MPRPARPWTDDERRLLGTMPDPEVARRLGIKVNAVRDYRWKHRIPGLLKRVHWTKKNLALLGTITDDALAHRMGVWQGTVTHQRARLGIASFAQRNQPWTKRHLRLLGTMTDRDLARRLGVTDQTVRKRRREYHIPTFVQPHVWTKREDALLGTMFDREAAKRIGVSDALVWLRREALGIPSFGRRPWTARDHQLMRRLPDAQVAAHLGRTPGSVRAERLKVGIRRRPPRRQVRWTEAMLDRLGTRSDEDIAVMCDLTPRAVADMRRRQRIPAWKSD